MKFLSSLTGLAVLLIALAFALANREPATISLWPLNIKVEAPLCLLTLGTFVLGLLLGVAIAWFSLLPHRFEARRLRKDLAGLQDKVIDLQQTVMPPARDDGGAPLLPSSKTKWPFRRTGS